MSGFAPEWLRLREPADTAARASSLATFLPASATATRSIVDLGCGTGANMRYLAPLLGGAQAWTLVDDDPGVLDAVSSETAAWARGRYSWQHAAATGESPLVGPDFSCRVRTARLDLSRDLDELLIEQHALVTSSALLDLVSAEWLYALAARCRAAGASVLFALTYDGRMSPAPEDPDDALVQELVNEHQRTDKGFGPALGPGAAAAAVRAFSLVGYDVRTARSDWQIAADAGALQEALIAGWHAAAVELAPKRAAALARWRKRRLLHLARGESTLRVGHVDLAARLP